MKKIGVIGGMSFESIVIYYWMINEQVCIEFGGFLFVDMLVYLVNFVEIVVLQKVGDWVEVVECLVKFVVNFEKVGVSCIFIVINIMYKVVDEVVCYIYIFFINIIDVIVDVLKVKYVKKLLLLVICYMMEDGFYVECMVCYGLMLVILDYFGCVIMYDVIFNEFCVGYILDVLCKCVIEIIEKVCDVGVDSVILGCMEICMLIEYLMSLLLIFDLIVIYVVVVVDFLFVGMCVEMVEVV